MRKTFSVSYDPDEHLKVQEFLDYIKLNRLDRSEAVRTLIEGKKIKLGPVITRIEIEELWRQINELQKNGVRVIERVEPAERMEPAEDNPVIINQLKTQPVLEVKKEFIRNRYFSNK